jgi:hypothetical protein
MKYILFLAGFHFAIMCSLNAQIPVPFLEKKISVAVENQELSVVLAKIGQAGGFSFSYNPAIGDFSKLVTIKVNQKPVREILQQLLSNEFDFRERDKYIILKKAKVKKVKSETKEYITVSGYVKDSDGLPLSWVSIYDKVSLKSTVSNDYGFYSMEFYTRQLPVNLYFSKQQFIDTVLRLTISGSSFQNVVLTRIPKPSPVIPSINIDSLAKHAEDATRSFFKSYEKEPNQLNISDTLYREFQVSLIPFVGTNGELCGNVINKYSLNVFGGYSLGTQALEMAGFFSLNRGDISSVQLAGFLNMTGGKVKGVQAAGFTNLVRGDVNGVQAAGFVNTTWSDLKGAQFAGYVNVVKGKVDGAQFAGFVNCTLDSMEGFQASGFCNYVGGSLKGSQLSGFVNVVSNDLKGTQIGFLNYAKNVKGSQVGFLNFTDSTNGVPIGFLSFVNTGYHKLEISTDELLPFNISLRTGVNAFHNILSAGINPGTGDTLLWNFGYGFGTTYKLTPKTAIDFDITSSQMVKGNNFDKINLVNRAALGVDFSHTKKTSIALAFTFNAQLTNSNYQNYPDIFTWTKPDVFNTTTYPAADLDLKFWWGFKAGIRFF